MKLDYEAMASQLLRAVRGRRSQVAFSRRLGYASNVAYTWESGRRWPTASTFLHALQRTGVDVPTVLTTFALPPQPGAPRAASTQLDGPDRVAAFLQALKGNASVREIALRAGRSRFAVSRWLKGQAEPRLPDLLRVVQAMSLRVLDLVAQLVDPAELPSTRRAWRRLEATRALARASPWAQAVLLALELDSYRDTPSHDDAWLADHLRIHPGHVTDAIGMLLQTGQISRRGDHYVPVVIQAVDVGPTPSGPSPHALKAHWSEVALQRLREGAPGLFSYNLVVVSEHDLAQIEALQRAHYRAIRALVADSEPAERLVLLNLQTVPIDVGQAT
ncbi:MAG: DUF4423 domain-containing protein [Myxococcales bacterium]|nr:DUF4423 domain-containing protein [Myxococcales bacterium]